ncbi:hypothetical protein E4U41_006231 [Claviceps citrina]|nr:hypothetical protein E4U41_006231 [Claviceps citrina]
MPLDAVQLPLMVSQPDQPPPASTAGVDITTSSHCSDRQCQCSPSVVSRRALSRTKRHDRSQLGGCSRASQNEFPVFAHGGDVEIMIRVGPGADGVDSVERRYLLHRHTLTRCSGFFEASTSDEWSRARPLRLAGGNELARIDEDAASTLDAPDSASFAVGGGGGGGGGGGDGGRLDASDVTSPKWRWKYELDLGAGNGDVPMLVQKDPSSPATAGSSRPSFPSLFGSGSGSGSGSGASATSQSQLLGSVGSKNGPPAANHVANLSPEDQALLRDYDNLFRIFYNYRPVLDGVNVADAYVQCKSLLALADQYDALAVVGPRVDHHLLQFQSRLWKQIAKYPVSYIRLGYLARSKVIFQEALIHVVGQWPMGERNLRASLPDFVLDMIEDKVAELEEIVSRVEGRLFRLSLTTSKGERVRPGSNFLDWLVVSLFRQWLADNIAPQALPERHTGNSTSTSSTNPPRLPAPRPRIPPLVISGRAFRVLGSGCPAAFLDHDDCKKFLKLAPEFYSRSNLRRFEKRMDELKSLAQDLVRPLLASGLELDVAGSSRFSDGVAYLTCTSLGSRELPWPVDM